MPLCKTSAMSRFILSVVLLLGLTACAAGPRGFPAPKAETYRNAELPGYQNIRFFADEAPVFQQGYLDSYREILKSNPELAARQDGLVLSGGAEDGAYGAGFLKGWTESGERPEFSWVTGISTGALIAPFAFLGAEYDDTIARLYTETSANEIILLKPLRVVLGASALGDTAPLRKTIKETVDAKFVAAIARESRRGRILLIGTTNLDAQRHVIWNIGTIAESGRTDAPDLIGKILLASASIPGAFPPVKFDVVIDGKRHQELHVDGGITHQIFAYPIATPVREIEQKLGISPKKTMWVVRNTKIEADFEATGLGVADIASRSINTLTKYQGQGDLFVIQQLAKRDGYDFRLTFVPGSFDAPYTEFFDQEYMRALYDVGYRAAKSDKSWETTLENVIVRDEILVPGF